MSTDDTPEREVVIYDREGFPRASLEVEEGPSNVFEKEDVSNSSNSTEKPKSCRTPRREVRWLDLGARNRSLESIKQLFQDRLDRFLPSSNSLLRRITSPMNSKLRHNLHQCPGYLREEITLASDVSKSVIVSHAFPSQSEICSICGQLVQYNRTEPSIVDGEKLEAPTSYPSQDNFRNMDSPLSSSMEGADGEPANIDPVSFLASLDPSLRQAVLMGQDEIFLRTLPPYMIAEAGVYRNEVHARRLPTSLNPTVFAAEQGLPATGVSQYGALADARGSQKAESVVSVGERSHSRQPRSSYNVPTGSQTDVLPAPSQVPKVNLTTGRTINASHKQDAKFACPVPGCRARYTRAFNLKTHLRSHLKPYKCHWPGCGKGFARQHDYKRHEQFHSNFGPFECEGCRKQFVRMDALNRHLSNETGVECARVAERGKGSGGGVLGDSDSGFDMSGITLTGGVELAEEQKQPRILKRRQTGGGGGADIWSL